VFILASAFALGCLLFRSLPLPGIARLGLGAAVQSLIVFLLLEAGWANRWWFLAIGCAAMAALFWIRPVRLNEAVTAPLDTTGRWLFGIVLAVYITIYAICAAAPEIQADATAYHLGLTAEYVRLGHFPERIGFYEVLPQGLEMLFTGAFAFGQHVAAKLVHFAFLLGTVPLMLATGRRLGFTDRAALGAGILYLCMPVAGISGTCAYNDAALVFFIVLTFYLLLLWNTDRRTGYVLAAGIAAGFCYAVKFTGLPIVAGFAMAVLVMSRSWRPVAIAMAGAAVSIVPWMMRAVVLTGNPFAPLLNRWFPNPYFNTTTDQILGAFVKTYGNFHWNTAVMEYAFRGGMQGVTGPVLLMLPLGFLALRKRAGRWLAVAAAIAIVPWWWNVGTRFLMPAIPFMALALAMVAPRAVLYLCIAVQAVLCWPSIVDRLEDPNRWSLHEIPWQAALRMESEDAYLNRVAGDYPVARMVEEKTEPGDRIFCLNSAARAYSTRELLDYWHSTPLLQLSEAVQAAYFQIPMVTAAAQWPVQQLRALRVGAAAGASNEWRVFEFRIFAPGGRVFPDRQWSLNASPNRWDATWTVDENRSTAWRTRDPVQRGMFVQADLGRAQELSGAAILEAGSSASLPLTVDGLEVSGKWKHLADLSGTLTAPSSELRHEAMSALHRARFRYVLVQANEQGMGLIGADMLKRQSEWGVKDVGETTPFHLFRIL
jgi:hypothetical protein